MSDVIIRVENLGKRYRIPHQGERQHYVALRDVIAQKAKSFFRSRKSAVSGQPLISLRAVVSEPEADLRPPLWLRPPSSVLRRRAPALRPPRWLHFHILSPKVIVL